MSPRAATPPPDINLTDVADAILALIGRVLARDYPQDAAGSVAREVARTLSEAGLLADSYDRLLLAVAAARKAKAETVEVIHEHRDGTETRERVPRSEVDALLISHNHEAFEAGTVETWASVQCR